MNFIKNKATLAVLIFSVSLLLPPSSFAQHQASLTKYQKLNYASLLGWVTMSNHYNICDGFYRELPIPYAPNPLVQSQRHNYSIAADHVSFSQKGTSILRGNVRISQPDQALNTGLAYLYHSKKTGKINLIKAYKGVRLFQPGNLLVAQYAILHPSQNRLKFYNAAYRMASAEADKRLPVKDPKTGRVTAYRRYQLNYWGHATTITQTKAKNYVLKDATLTTCPPTGNAWHLHATTLDLNKKTGVGTSWNTVLYIKKVPVFYFPYFNFPLNHKRKSGFLMPSFAVNSQSGYSFTLPFYWNIAPNYDATITPTYYSKRGLFTSILFRYLTPDSIADGLLHFGFIFKDREFADFQKTAQSNPKYLTPKKGKPRTKGLKNLANNSDNRYAFAWRDMSQYDDNWSSIVDFSYVSDDYYIQDFGTRSINSRSLLNNSKNQLLQKAQMQYQTQHWAIAGLVQGYQTLHPVNQALVENQYVRLPELDAVGQYDIPISNLNFSVSMDGVNFTKIRTPDSSEPIPVVGERYSVVPELQDPLYWDFGFLVPTAKVNLLSYNVEQQNANVTPTTSLGALSPNKFPATPSNAIPTFDLLGGLFFDRDFDLFGHQYVQTLEPEFFYLYVPFQNQDDLPIFDTTTQAFNYNFLFQDNRFSGLDRLGDANQVTLALTSRFINPATGIQEGSVSIGDIYYLHNRRVTLCSGTDVGKDPECESNALDRRTFSPIAGQATFAFDDAWRLTGQLTWNPYAKQFSYEELETSYEPKPNDVINLSYNEVESGGQISGKPEGSPETVYRQLGVSFAWTLVHHLDLIGAYNYIWDGNTAGISTSGKEVEGTTANHGNVYLAGLEYNSCCWSVRLVAARTFQGVGTQGENQFSNGYYLQFALKGLGYLGNNDPDNLLTSKIAGYVDHFGQITS